MTEDLTLGGDFNFSNVKGTVAKKKNTKGSVCIAYGLTVSPLCPVVTLNHVTAYTTQGVEGSHHSLVLNIVRPGRFGSAGLTRQRRNVAGPRNSSLTSCFPRLQSHAADFVFGQLSDSVMDDFDFLCKELSNRFMKKFDRRTQKHGESLEAYVAELKRLYNKAYPDREDKTRREDLLRRFLDGVLDRDAAQQVAFMGQVRMSTQEGYGPQPQTAQHPNGAGSPRAAWTGSNLTQ